MTGEPIYKYEKVSDTVVKITATETDIKVTSDDTTIEDLLVKRATLVSRRAQAITNHMSALAGFDTEISLIDEQIAETKALGVTETVVEEVVEIKEIIEPIL